MNNAYKLPYRIHLVPITGASVESTSWACGECRSVCFDYKQALSCCRTPLCNRCGKDTGKKYYLVCDDCRSKAEHERQEAAWDKMPEVPYDGGPIYDGDCFYQNDEDYFGDYHPDGSDCRVELCDEKRMGYDVTPDTVLNFINERMLEDIEDDDDTAKIEGEEELRIALQKFFDCQTYMVWVPNGKKAFLEKPEYTDE